MTRRIPLPTLLALAAAALLGASPAAGQDRPPRPKSSEQCRQCHFPQDGDPGIGRQFSDFLRDENPQTWLSFDKHRQGLYLLLAPANLPRTERILQFPVADVLDYAMTNDGAALDQAILKDQADEAGAAKRALLEQCLACHAPAPEPLPLDPSQQTLAFGVSCQACHGPASEWEDPHRDIARVWRAVSAEEKARFGMTDVRNAAVRSALCASCHVGGVWDGQVRFVRHEWYALGHPPLPSFEHAAFTHAMPAHWDTLPEKLAPPAEPFVYYDAGPNAAAVAAFADDHEISPEAIRPGGFREANAHSLSADPARDLTRARDLAVGAVQAAASYVGLRERAQADAALAGDFALYDCGSCHHELRTHAGLPDGRPFGRVLGRPGPPEWLRSLLPVAQEHLARQLAAGALPQPETDAADLARLGEQWSEFELAAARGRPGETAALQSLLADMAADLSRAPYAAADVEALLPVLAAAERTEYRDFHAARQAAWGIRELAKDAHGLPFRTGMRGQPETEPRPPLLSLWEDEGRDPLAVRLPAGQEESVLGHLPLWLRAWGEFDPAPFRARLRTLPEELR